jgi:glycosyltransferase involved in cell wall biosynthesis
MPAITALLHTQDDALRLGRALETLLPCDEILVVDHGSRDATRRIAREYGARVVEAAAYAAPSQCLQFARCEWILCLEPRESLTEALAASLFEWRSELKSESRAAWKSESRTSPAITAFSIFLREETAGGWVENPTPQVRVVRHNWNQWKGLLPAPGPPAITLEGALLRFVLP